MEHQNPDTNHSLKQYRNKTSTFHRYSVPRFVCFLLTFLNKLEFNIFITITSFYQQKNGRVFYPFVRFRSVLKRTVNFGKVVRNQRPYSRTWIYSRTLKFCGLSLGLGVQELKNQSLGFGVRELKTSTKNAFSSHIKVGRFVRNYLQYFLIFF